MGGLGGDLMRKCGVRSGGVSLFLEHHSGGDAMHLPCLEYFSGLEPNRILLFLVAVVQ